MTRNWMVGLGAAALLCLLPAPAEAQNGDPAVLYFCYIPNSGTVYRIKGPGLPDACRGHHVEFSIDLGAGTQGPPGPQGEPGPQGPPGPAGEGDPAALAALQANIDAETAARQAADATLQANTDAEAAARQAADVTLQTNIDAETAARQAADATLQSNIDAEAAARAAAVATAVRDRELVTAIFNTAPYFLPCPGSKVPLGGGHALVAPAPPGVQVYASWPSGNGWEVSFAGPQPFPITLHVICGNAN